MCTSFVIAIIFSLKRILSFAAMMEATDML